MSIVQVQRIPPPKECCVCREPAKYTVVKDDMRRVNYCEGHLSREGQIKLRQQDHNNPLKA